MHSQVLFVVVASNGAADTASARKFLEAADKTNDKMVFFNVFRYLVSIVED